MAFANEHIDSVKVLKTNEEKIDYISQVVSLMSLNDPKLASELASITDSIGQYVDKPGLKAKILTVRGMALVGNREYDKAIKNYLESIDLFKVENESDNLAKVYNNLAVVYQVSGDIDGCIDYLKKALAIFEEVRDTSRMGFVTQNLAQQYYSKKEYEESDFYFEKSGKYFDHIGNVRYQAIQALNYGLLKVAMASYSEAENLLLKAKSLADEKTSRFDRSNIRRLTYRNCSRNYGKPTR